MSQPSAQEIIQVSPQFQEKMPAPPPVSAQVAQLATISMETGTKRQLSCRDLLVGQTRVDAKSDAADLLPKMLANAQVFSVYGKDAMDGVNDLTDKMLNERPSVNIPELREAMSNLSRQMRSIGKRYDPSDPKVLEKYEKAKGRFLGVFRMGKTFFEEFMDDIRSFRDQIEVAIEKLEGKQYQLLRNVSFYDAFYELNEQEIGRLIYKIAVMEEIRDLAATQAANIKVGDANRGDRLGEEQARILEFVNQLEGRIISYEGRLWGAWAMAPQIRNMRGISLGYAARIDQTVDVTIPMMKNAIVVWFSLGEAQQAAAVNQAVEDTFNFVMQSFANSAKVAVPAMAEALATPALDPRTIVAWTESLTAQAEGIIKALETGQLKRAELEEAMLASKDVLDANTLKVNQAKLDYLLEAARNANTIEIARSVPPTAELAAGSQS